MSDFCENPLIQIQQIYPDLTGEEFALFCNPRQVDGDFVMDWGHPDYPEPTAAQIAAAKPAGDALIAAQSARKIWPNANQFLTEFTDPERNSLANNPHVAGLALLLTSWQGEVWADDPQILGGMAALVQVGVITQARHDEILS